MQWLKNMVMFDTNMILRYLLDDNTDMADKADGYIKKGNVCVTIEVIAEVVYVLKGVYSMDRDKISKTLAEFLPLVKCRDIDVLKVAIDIFAERNLDFIDCVLYAYHSVNGTEIATFDKKLLKLINSA